VSSETFKATVLAKGDNFFVQVPRSIVDSLKLEPKMDVLVAIGFDDEPSEPRLKKRLLPEQIMDWFHSYPSSDPLVVTARTISTEFTIPASTAAIVLSALVHDGSLKSDSKNGVSRYCLKETKIPKEIDEK